MDLPYVVNGKPYKGGRGETAPQFDVTSAMRWDPKRKLLWIHNPISFWVLTFDPETATSGRSQ